MSIRPTLFIVLIGFYTLSHAQLFTEVTVQSQINFSHVNQPERRGEPTVIAAGGAVEDYDNDGYPDFYLVGGTDNSNALFRNMGDGTFTDMALFAGVNIYDTLSSGPVFVDVDGDFDLDLVVFSINQAGQLGGDNTGDSIENKARIFINLGNGSFTESMNTGFYSGMPSFSGTFGDLDNDGDLDLFMTHWHADNTTSRQLFWSNDGQGTFSDITIEMLGSTQNALFDPWTFTPNLTDLNNDGKLDVLLASDFGTTRILHSTGVSPGQPTYLISQPAYITDENGMGAALADYDNDGDLDWFVTSIWDPNGIPEANWGVSGNRLYRNTNTGNIGDTFEDATDEAGLREGYWGWGACFADFNNDGHLDIYHENGFPNDNFAQEFAFDPARLYLANGDGTFTESATINGLNHTGQGRGVSCVDYDMDGDLDVLVMPNDAAYRLYRNNLDNGNNYLGIRLTDQGPNPYAYHARVSVTTATSTQMREISGGNNYVSNNPLTQHFGLAQEDTINQINITWPDGISKTINNSIPVNEVMSIGRYCHTKYLDVIAGDVAGHVTLRMYAHDLTGNVLSATNVSIEATLGPNQGHIANSSTDSNGLAEFVLNYQSPGTDRLTFRFEVNQTEQQCHALVRWFEDTIYDDSFEVSN